MIDYHNHVNVRHRWLYLFIWGLDIFVFDWLIDCSCEPVKKTNKLSFGEQNWKLPIFVTLMTIIPVTGNSMCAYMLYIFVIYNIYIYIYIYIHIHMNIYIWRQLRICIHIHIISIYLVPSNKHCASNKYRTLISAVTLTLVSEEVLPSNNLFPLISSKIWP